MASLDRFATDDELGEQGKWFTIVDPTPAEKAAGEKVVRFKIRSVRSKRYTDELRKLQRKYRPKAIANDGELTAEDLHEFDSVLAGRALVVAWEGVQDDQKNDLPFSQLNVQTKLRELPRLREIVYRLAKNDDAYRPATREERELMAGNS